MKRARERSRGSLTIVGTGIQFAAHVTPEAVGHIRKAEKVFYLVADPAASLWIRRLNRRSESLRDCYARGKPRHASYLEMVDRILAQVRRSQRVCVALYGHPGVFVDPSHEAIRRARAEGFPARMLPAVSAEDCLFADLGVDPARVGCQSFEATDFLLNRRAFSAHSALVLWQVGVLGEASIPRGQPSPRKLAALVARLRRQYPRTHVVTLYEAALYAICDPTITPLPLSHLSAAHVPPLATLFVPPVPAARGRRRTSRLRRLAARRRPARSA